MKSISDNSFLHLVYNLVGYFNLSRDECAAKAIWYKTFSAAQLESTLQQMTFIEIRGKTSDGFITLSV